MTHLAKASWLSPCCCSWTLLTSSKVKGRAHESLLTGLTHWLVEPHREMLHSAAWRGRSTTKKTIRKPSWPPTTTDETRTHSVYSTVVTHQKA